VTISLLDNSLKVTVFFEEKDCEFDDNVCVSFAEVCPDEERIFRAEETNIYLTPKQAHQLAKALEQAAQASEQYCSEADVSE
jgi:hypothetical protein